MALAAAMLFLTACGAAGISVFLFCMARLILKRPGRMVWAAVLFVLAGLGAAAAVYMTYFFLEAVRFRF